MIACDTSSLVAYLKGEKGRDIDLLDGAISSGELILPPAVLTEVLSDPISHAALAPVLPDISLLEIRDGYWHRAGLARQKLRQQGLKSKIGDTLIAQSCIDHDVELLTRDNDFRHFEAHCGLKLA